MPSLETDSSINSEEKLKSALWYSIGRAVDSLSPADQNATPHFIGALAELVWSQAENVAQDLEAFAQHAGRDTVRSQDVVMLGRRNEGLKELLLKEVEAVKANDKGRKG